MNNPTPQEPTAQDELTKLEKDIALYGIDYGIILPDGFISDIVLLIEAEATRREREARIDELKMMRELYPLMPVGLEHHIGKRTKANDYIIKRLNELKSQGEQG